VPSRPHIQKAILVIALPGVAGVVNTTGLFAVGAYASHMTGTLSRMGDALAHHELGSAQLALFTLLTFGLGAMLATVLVELSSRFSKGRYTSALLIEAAAIGAVAVGTHRGGMQESQRLTFLLLLSGAMGLQNALVTRISGAVVRTTHMTGVITDLGIELVHLLSWFRKRAQRTGLRGSIDSLYAMTKDAELERIRLHFAIVSSFLAGSILGPVLYLRSGTAAFAVPSVLLLVLALFDVTVGFRSQVVGVTLPELSPPVFSASADETKGAAPKAPEARDTSSLRPRL
jgi:uncharacterized membrane protein YoaK (UPF0700 family)